MEIPKLEATCEGPRTSVQAATKIDMAVAWCWFRMCDTHTHTWVTSRLFGRGLMTQIRDAVNHEHNTANSEH